MKLMSKILAKVFFVSHRKIKSLFQWYYIICYINFKAHHLLFDWCYLGRQMVQTSKMFKDVLTLHLVVVVLKCNNFPFNVSIPNNKIWQDFRMNEVVKDVLVLPQGEQMHHMFCLYFRYWWSFVDILGWHILIIQNDNAYKINWNLGMINRISIARYHTLKLN